MDSAFNFLIENIASNIIDSLYGAATSLVEDCCLSEHKVEQLDSLNNKLMSLNNQLPKVKAVVHAVNNGGLGLRETDDDLRQWSWHFKDAIEAAEDVLGEIAYYEINNKLHPEHVSVTSTTATATATATANNPFAIYRNKVTDCFASYGIFSGIKRKLDVYLGDSKPQKDQTEERLKNVVDQLANVITDMTPFLNLGLPSIDARCREHHNFLHTRQATGGLQSEQVIARENEKQHIINWLMRSDHENPQIDAENSISAFTIVGEGGMGKTALARYVKNDSGLRNRFDLVLWVCVSTRFDVSRITKDIIQEINKEQKLPQSLNALQETLKGQLLSKRFILVLDDVWNVDNRLQWDNLMAPLKFARKGSKILVTTRMKSVAKTIANVIETKEETLELNGLEDELYLQLFKRHAFSGTDQERLKDLRLIGEEIAKQLGGCPLAAKILGEQLNRNLREDYWDRVRNEKIKINADSNENGLKAILRLSYQKLNISLQKCLSFCSMFPKDYIFQTDELIYMWIGSGIILEKNGFLEDIGLEYINDLERGSFFKKISSSTSSYVMHDVLHDVARSVSAEECLSIEDYPLNANFPPTIRHLYISAEAKNNSPFHGITQLKKLRTLIIAFKGDDPLGNHVALLSMILAKLGSLRVLSIMASFSCKLPDIVGSSIHLRHLSIHQTTNASKLDWFPEIVYKLYNLRILRLIGGSGGDYVGVNIKGLTNLINLQHLEIPGAIKDRIPCIGRLEHLRGSVNFHVSDQDEDYKITELKNLTVISELCVSNLEKVGSFQEAKEINLSKKENLRSLNLIWSYNSNRDADNDKRVADELCIPARLRKLTIKGYNGKFSPRWVTMFSVKKYFLTSISLIQCCNWKELPDLTQLPLLEILQIKDVGLVTFPKIFEASSLNPESPITSPSLEKLEIKYCTELKELQPNGFKNIKSLKSLCIGECRNLTTSDSTEFLPTTLENLSIGSCTNLEIPLLTSFEYLTSLKNLSLENCATITALPNSYTFSKLSSLTSLMIKKCIALESLGGLEALPSISSLTIFGCNKLIGPHSNSSANSVTDHGGARNTNLSMKLKFLQIDKESLLSIEPLRNLVAVEEIKIGDASDVSNFQAPVMVNRTLTRLYICNANQANSLPNFPTSLQILHVCGCSADLLRQHQNGATSTVRSNDFRQDQCRDHQLFMSVVEFDRRDLV